MRTTTGMDQAQPSPPGEDPDRDRDIHAAIVLLAAGEGRRFGGAKQLAMLAGEPMVHRTTRLLLGTGAPVIVVTGAHADEVEAVLDDLPVYRVRNSAWQEGMGSSIAVGFRYLIAHFATATGALLSLADQPLPNADVARRMLQRHAQAPNRLLAVTQAGIAGPPVLFPRDCFAELSEWSGTAGARALLNREAGRLEAMPFDLPVDVDTKADLDQANRQLRFPTDSE